MVFIRGRVTTVFPLLGWGLGMTHILLIKQSAHGFHKGASLLLMFLITVLGVDEVCCVLISWAKKWKHWIVTQSYLFWDEVSLVPRPSSKTVKRCYNFSYGCPRKRAPPSAPPKFETWMAASLQRSCSNHEWVLHIDQPDTFLILHCQEKCNICVEGGSGDETRMRFVWGRNDPHHEFVS